MKKSELIHWQLQAMLRENSFNEDNLVYLGVRKDSIGMPQHWYSIGCLLYTSPSPRDE